MKEILKELIEILINILGFLLIYKMIDYKRKKSIIRFNKTSGWIIFFVITIAGILIKIRL